MDKSKTGFFKKFPGQFWLVVLFEFFERGSYYGMMSFISVYFTDSLNIPKENVGLIKGVIQPLLYFLPIIAGAVADRFGYRKILMVAFSLLGTGYFLTSQMTTYSAVFLALVVMGVGAGMFKPIISGTIARVTDKSNSTQAFGIYYWSINLGAFLFPLFLVPFLKSMNPSYVIIASAICTGMLIIPAALFYKDPVKKEKNSGRKETSLLRTLADAFEIIYSPLVLLSSKIKKSKSARFITLLFLAALLYYSVTGYLQPPQAEVHISKVSKIAGDLYLAVDVSRNMSTPSPFKIKSSSSGVIVTIHRPDDFDSYSGKLITELNKLNGFEAVKIEEIKALSDKSVKKINLIASAENIGSLPFRIEKREGAVFKIIVNSKSNPEQIAADILKELKKMPSLKAITKKDLSSLLESVSVRSFFLLFLASIVLLSLLIIPFSEKKFLFLPVLAIVLLMLLPGLTLLGRIISAVIYLSMMSLVVIDKSDTARFVDHAKFLLMIVLYSGFWVLYFQMFDSVLWYVQAYVDAASLNSAVNSFLSIFGININWFFDVEHVTVINAGVIIMLQLFISNIVKNKKALPTMMTGITIATLGMAMLAVSANIWVFMIGIILFSIGEMTAHPKFISYIGVTAPPDKKAMYMGYLFLYGVFGSSVGGVVGAKLYVHFVDNLNSPSTLWLIFSGIGVITIVSLLLYNKYLAPKRSET